MDMLDPGKAAVITLAERLQADAVVLDDRAGVRVARSRGLRVLGTLGLLDAAAARGYVDLPSACTKLKATTFHYPPSIMAALLEADVHRRLRK